MKQIRSVTIFLILFSFVFADHGRSKHKRWKHKKRHKVKVVHKQPRLKISLGYNYFWRNFFCINIFRFTNIFYQSRLIVGI